MVCKGGNSSERALECLNTLTKANGIFPNNFELAAYACSGGSTGAGATDCVKNFRIDAPLEELKNSISAIACGGANSASRASTCVKASATSMPLLQINELSQVHTSISNPSSTIKTFEANRYELAATACRGGSSGERVPDCLRSVANVIKDQAQTLVTRAVKGLSDSDAKNKIKKEMDKYNDVSLLYRHAAEACSANNNTDKAKECITTASEAFSKIYETPMVFVPNTCSFRQRGSTAKECMEVVLKIVDEAAKKSGFSQFGGRMNPLVYVERYCTGDIFSSSPSTGNSEGQQVTPGN